MVDPTTIDTETLPEGIDQHRDTHPAALWKQYLWDNWWNGTGPCGDCPIRCGNHREHPAFGAFSYDADIMLVGQEPGVSSDSFHTSNNKRAYKDTPTDAMEEANRLVDHRRYSERILGTERYEEVFGVETSTVDTVGWDFWHQHSSVIRLFEALEDDYNTEIDESDCYYTNSLKCSVLDTDSGVNDVEDPSKNNREAREVCRQYLSDEIALVEPVVIIPFGDAAVRQTLKAVDYVELVTERVGMEMNEVDYTYKLIGGKDGKRPVITYGNSPTVILSYHWSPPKIYSNIGSLGDWASDLDAYWGKIADRVHECLETSEGRD